jgi:hypothetical protein
MGYLRSATGLLCCLMVVFVAVGVLWRAHAPQLRRELRLHDARPYPSVRRRPAAPGRAHRSQLTRPPAARVVELPTWPGSRLVRSVGSPGARLRGSGQGVRRPATGLSRCPRGRHGSSPAESGALRTLFRRGGRIGRLNCGHGAQNAQAAVDAFSTARLPRARRVMSAIAAVRVDSASASRCRVGAPACAAARPP